MTTLRNVAFWIAKEATVAELGVVYKAMQKAIERLDRELYIDLSIGDYVRFRGSDPRLPLSGVRGAQAVVAEKKQKRIVVQMIDNLGRWTQGTLVRTSPSVLELIPREEVRKIKRAEKQLTRFGKPLGYKPGRMR